MYRNKHLLRLTSNYALLNVYFKILLILVNSDKPWVWKYCKHFICSVFYLALLTYSLLFYRPVSPETQTNINDQTGNLWKRDLHLFITKFIFKFVTFLNAMSFSCNQNDLLKKFQSKSLGNTTSEILRVHFKGNSHAQHLSFVFLLPQKSSLWSVLGWTTSAVSPLQWYWSPPVAFAVQQASLN